MDFDSVREHINGEIKTEFAAGHPTVPIAFENHPFKQPVNGPWIYVSMMPGESKPANLGGSNYFHCGVITVQCMVPADTGTKLLNDMGQTLFDILGDKNWSLPDGGYLTTYGVLRRNRGNINGFYTLNVMAEFRHQSQRG
jgi:hypothetical protein